MYYGIAPYFANSDEAGREVVLFVMAVMIASVWWPSHQLFKWLRKTHDSTTTFWLSIVGCTVLSVIMIALGILIGRHVSPAIRSLGSEGGGSPVDINFMWFPFALLLLGMWAGFLSGYVKMRISD